MLEYYSGPGFSGLVSYFTSNRASSIEFKIANTVIGSFVFGPSK